MLHDSQIHNHSQSITHSFFLSQTQFPHLMHPCNQCNSSAQHCVRAKPLTPLSPSRRTTSAPLPLSNPVPPFLARSDLPYPSCPVHLILGMSVLRARYSASSTVLPVARGGPGDATLHSAVKRDPVEIHSRFRCLLKEGPKRAGVSSRH